MATRKQKAAARRNIKKAIAANRRRGKKGKRSKGKRSYARRAKTTKTGTKRLKSVRRNLARATKSLKKAHALL